jgi:hypothetical protein
MSQVKELKELMLLVQQQEIARQAGSTKLSAIRHQHSALTDKSHLIFADSFFDPACLFIKELKKSLC